MSEISFLRLWGLNAWIDEIYWSIFSKDVPDRAKYLLLVLRTQLCMRKKLLTQPTIVVCGERPSRCSKTWGKCLVWAVLMAWPRLWLSRHSPQAVALQSVRTKFTIPSFICCPLFHGCDKVCPHIAYKICHLISERHIWGTIHSHRPTNPPL